MAKNRIGKFALCSYLGLERFNVFISALNECLKQLKKNLLLLLTLTGVLVGLIIGLSLRHVKLSNQAIMLIAFPGEMLMRMLKMLILPLFISSIVSGTFYLTFELYHLIKNYFKLWVT